MNRRQRYWYSTLVVCGIALVSLFAIWWFQPGHIPHNFRGTTHLLDFLLFLLVSYVVWHPIIMQILSWIIALHITDLPQKKPLPGKKVAFITTFVPGAESIDLLHKCLPAMVAATYEHDTWLLDEGNDPEVKRLCKQYGVKHFSRKPHAHYNEEMGGKFAQKTKAGNHNAWYDAYGNDYDYVAQVDTDFVPRKDFLIKTLGHFRDPQVAFVGTPQIYGNTEESLIARGAAEQTYNFYGPILRGLHGIDNTTLLIGANHVIRVAALQSVGHYSPHITEDLLTGMRLHASNWKSVYVHEPLAIGEGPSTWQAYFKQQMRWSYGCIDILFNHAPKLWKNLGFKRALYYFFLQQHYFSGLATFLGIVGLSFYFLFGLQTASMDLETFAALYIPILAVCSFIALWLQRFNVRKEEKGFLWAGKLISIAAWPIFFLGLWQVLRRKRLVYSVTPKGKQATQEHYSLYLFTPHLVLGVLCIADLDTAALAHRFSPIMVFWAASTALLMLFVPFSQFLIAEAVRLKSLIITHLQSFNDHYRVLEFRAPDASALPDAPTDEEKYRYRERRYNILLVFSVLSFTCISISTFHFLLVNPALWALFTIFTLSIVYFFISLAVNLFTESFDFDAHQGLVDAWEPRKYPTVDVFLPTAGEDLSVLENTWLGVTAMIKHYPGKVTAYCLDDSDRAIVKELTKRFDFKYVVRPNRGEFKKAGNLRHGYGISKGEFIVIFDADFRPRGDFLTELLPYFYKNEKIGIVQSPQYFDVSTTQNWLERGAGAVQELFYRFSQVSRQHHDASICVGSNAVYRRRALDDTGGTALIEHSEDVHTGFNMRMHGWTIQYLPVLLAKGLCPASMPAFFKQQYRWCMGSMSLLGSQKFWGAKLAIRTRLSYMSGFFYYISTAIASFYTPIIPLSLLLFIPDQIKLENYLLIFPAIIFTQIIYPIWHESIYGVEAWATRSVYGWAHLFAIYDAIIKRPMAWQPTGSKIKKDHRYTTFRWLQFFFNFVPALLWVSLAAYNMTTPKHLDFAPILFSGVYYLSYVSKVTFYTGSDISFHTPWKFGLGLLKTKRQDEITPS